jgi:NADPH:quinone reductase-like Zn-dependent oxidoreductase
MKAAFIRCFGAPSVLEYGERPDPVAREDEVVVDIRAASVNAADWKVRAGLSPLSIPFPHILGRDFSGIVSESGPEADLAAGDEVFGVCPNGSEGAYAERIAIPASLVARKPSSLSHVDAAAIALAGLTALVAIVDTLKLKRGEKILIQGGAGGVGSMAVQIAHAIGAHVVTTARPANHAYLRELGADEMIDYEVTDVAAALGDCDAALDTVGGDAIAMTFAALRVHGRAAFVAVGREAPEPSRAGLVSLRPDVQRSRANLERLLEFVARRWVRVPEVTTFPLAEAARAHELSEGRHVRGKLLLLS